jgi:hypothetical protein
MSTSAVSQLAPQTQSYSGDVERVIVIGVRVPPTRVMLQRADANTPLEFEYNAEGAGTLTIRKPGVPIHVDWAIALM